MQHPTLGLRSLVALLMLLGCTAAAFAFARDPAATPNDTIGQAMRQVDEALEVLAKGVNAENRKASLDELAKLETAVMTAKSQTPDAAEKVDEKKRAAFVNDFRKTMIETLQFALAAEVAIVDGKYKEADTLIRNKLSAMKSEGHGKFKPAGGK